MPRRSLSVTRLMRGVGLAALGLASMRGLGMKPGFLLLSGVTVIPALALAMDRALSDEERRPFWLGFLASGALFLSVVAMPELEVRFWNAFEVSIMPTLVPGYHPERNRMVFHAATGWRPLSASEQVYPRMAYAAGGAVLGMILALAGGFLGAIIAGIGRAAARLADRSGLPDNRLQRTPQAGR